MAEIMTFREFCAYHSVEPSDRDTITRYNEYVSPLVREAKRDARWTTPHTAVCPDCGEVVYPTINERIGGFRCLCGLLWDMSVKGEVKGLPEVGWRT